MLTETQANILKAEKGLLQDFVETLASSDGAAEDIATLQRALLDLDDLFLLVVVGEFNSGKSAFVNALVGEGVMPEGVTPTTAAITLLRHAPARSELTDGEGAVEIGYPADFLREITIVDTPGTNAVIRRHEEVSRRFVPRSDLVLFVTSVDRPFTESERAFLEHIREWGKKVVIVLNKIDIVGADDVDKVVDFVRQNAQSLLGFSPEIFPISAKLAEQAKAGGPPDVRQRAWQASRFAPLEKYVTETLDETGRFRLKLLTPLGVADRLARRYAEASARRLDLLQEDFRTIEDIEAQLSVYRADMRRELTYHLSHIENTVHSMNARGMRFFEDTLRLARVFDLIRAERVRHEFEKTVVGDTPQEIEESVQGLIDWMVDQDLRMWQAVMSYLERRRATREDERMIGQLGAGYEQNRRGLLNSVGQTARRVVQSYDREAEARELAESVRVAVAQATLTEVGAIGLGTAITVLIGTAAADVTGILAAGVVAGLGLLVIPAKKRRAQAEFQQKTESLRERLVSAMRHQFDVELDQSLGRIREAIAPYTRLVRAEHEKASRQAESLHRIAEEIDRLRRELGGPA